MGLPAGCEATPLDRYSGWPGSAPRYALRDRKKRAPKKGLPKNGSEILEHRKLDSYVAFFLRLYISCVKPVIAKNQTPSVARCHGTSNVAAHASSAAIASSVARGATNVGSSSSSLAARSRRRRNSSLRRTTSALGRVPERRRETGHSSSGNCNALCATSRNARRRRGEKYL